MRDRMNRTPGSIVHHERVCCIDLRPCLPACGVTLRRFAPEFASLEVEPSQQVTGVTSASPTHYYFVFSKLTIWDYIISLYSHFISIQCIIIFTNTLLHVALSFTHFYADLIILELRKLCKCVSGERKIGEFFLLSNMIIKLLQYQEYYAQSRTAVTRFSTFNTSMLPFHCRQDLPLHRSLDFDPSIYQRYRLRVISKRFAGQVNSRSRR